VAIKFTSGIFAIAIGVLLLWRRCSGTDPLVAGAAVRCGGRAGHGAGLRRLVVVVVAQLRQPGVPALQFAVRVAVRAQRTHRGAALPARRRFGLLSRLWEMADIRAYTTTEAFVPDLRPLAAVLLGLLLLARRLLQRAPGLTGPALRARPDVQLGLFVLLSYPLWMMSSGNSRYAAIWIMACALLLVRSAQWLSQGRRWVAMGVAVLVGLNLAAYIADGDHRLGLEQRWDSGAYLPMQIPERLRTQPFLHLSVGVQSYSALAPFIHRDGAMVNVSGQMSLPTSGPLGDRLQQRLKAWEGRTRFLLAPHVKLDGPKFAAAIKDENFAQSHRLGLGIDTRDCERIRVLRSATGNERDSVFYLLSCAAVRAPRPDPELDRRVAHDEQVFRLLEARCPRVFGPTPFVTEYGPDLTWRRYLNSDVRINVSPTDGVVLTHYRARNPVTLGSAQDVINNGGRDACLAWKRLEIE
jgi:hypothetical protein